MHGVQKVFKLYDSHDPNSKHIYRRWYGDTTFGTVSEYVRLAPFEHLLKNVVGFRTLRIIGIINQILIDVSLMNIRKWVLSQCLNGVITGTSSPPGTQKLKFVFTFESLTQVNDLSDECSIMDDMWGFCGTPFAGHFKFEYVSGGLVMTLETHFPTAESESLCNFNSSIITTFRRKLGLPPGSRIECLNVVTAEGVPQNLCIHNRLKWLACILAVRLKLPLQLALRIFNTVPVRPRDKRSPALGGLY